MHTCVCCFEEKGSLHQQLCIWLIIKSYHVNVLD